MAVLSSFILNPAPPTDFSLTQKPLRALRDLRGASQFDNAKHDAFILLTELTHWIVSVPLQSALIAAWVRRRAMAIDKYSKYGINNYGVDDKLLR